METFNRDEIVLNMCKTFDHSFGLMSKEEQDCLFKRMGQVFDNDIAGNLMTNGDMEDYEERIAELEEKLEQNSIV